MNRRNPSCYCWDHIHWNPNRASCGCTAIHPLQPGSGPSSHRSRPCGHWVPHLGSLRAHSPCLHIKGHKLHAAGRSTFGARRDRMGREKSPRFRWIYGPEDQGDGPADSRKGPGRTQDMKRLHTWPHWRKYLYFNFVWCFGSFVLWNLIYVSNIKLWKYCLFYKCLGEIVISYVSTIMWQLFNIDTSYVSSS